MIVLKAPCYLCGEPGIIDGLCETCYNKEHPLAKVHHTLPLRVCKRCGSPLKWKMEICPKCQQKIIVGWPDVINEVVSFLVWVITLGPIGTLLERNTIGGTILRYTPLLGTLLHISDAVNPYAASPKRQRGVNPRRAEIVFVVDNDTKLPMPLPLVAWNGFPPLTMELIKGEIQREKDNGRKEVLTKTLLIVEALFLSNYEE